MLGANVLKILGLGVIGLGFLLAYLAYRLLNKEQGKTHPDRLVLRSIHIFMAFSILLCLLGFVSQIFDQTRSTRQLEADYNKLKEKYETITQSQRLLSETRGKLRSPANPVEVDKSFTCKGTTTNFKVGRGVHLYLAVEVKNMLYFKEPEVHVDGDGTWTADVHHTSDDPTFSLNLYASDEEAHGRIMRWIDDGKLTSRGYENPFNKDNSLVGTMLLHQVNDLRPLKKK